MIVLQKCGEIPGRHGGFQPQRSIKFMQPENGVTGKSPADIVHVKISAHLSAGLERVYRKRLLNGLQIVIFRAAWVRRRNKIVYQIIVADLIRTALQFIEIIIDRVVALLLQRLRNRFIFTDELVSRIAP